MDYRDEVKIVKNDGTEHIIPALSMEIMRRVEGHNIKQYIPLPYKAAASAKVPEAVVAPPQKQPVKSADKKLSRDEMDFQARALKIKNYHRMSDDTLRNKLKLAKKAD